MPWLEIARRQLQSDDRRRVDLDRIKRRGADLHLRWSCSGSLGAPPGPFTVWTRRPATRPADVEVVATSDPLGVLLSWDGRTAVTLEVECTPIDPGRAVAVWGFRGPVSPFAAVGVESVHPGGAARISLVLRTGGMTHALLINGRDPFARVDNLRAVIEDDSWEELERVGLPVDAGRWAGTGYDAGPQGMVASPVDPVDAAVERLLRAGPPLGWWPATESGRIAPDWAAPDPRALVDEVRSGLLGEIEPLYDPGLPPFGQAGVSRARAVDPPVQDGRASTQPSQARTRPFGVLMLAATTDPFLALTTGFGTGYPLGERESLPGKDFLITADYPDTPEGGPATYAAFVPWPGAHGDTAPVTGLSAGRDGVIRPVSRDRAWRETVRLRWDHVESSALLGRPSGVALARFDPAGGPEAEPMLEKRDSGGWHTPVPTRAPSAPDAPPADHDAAVDAAAEIPIGSGGRTVGYAVAVQDVFGVWSRWEDTGYVGTEPAAPAPRVLAVRVDSGYAGSTLCPATMEVQVGLDWSNRTATRLEVFAVLFPAAKVGAAPPPGVTATGPAPAGCIRVDLSAPFSGDALVVPTGTGVRYLDAAGEAEVAPGPAQSEASRRYVLTTTAPALDFGTQRHWGVAVWAREHLAVAPSPGPVAPAAAPALAYASTPVPPAVPAPPPLPGVPVGSAPDAQGQSHVRVAWPTPAGAVSRFIVYEIAETALRTAAGLAAPAASASPGARLAELWAAYDALPSDRRRAVFRRVREVDGWVREADVALPRGSTDIHLFVVTARNPANVESAWPPDHTHLQAFMAPRVVAPSAPSVSPSFETVGGATGVRLELSVVSTVDVVRFLLFRTRSEFAARSAETMGPPFAEAPAIVSADPSTPTGARRFDGSWSGSLPGTWQPWLVRAVAVPVAEVPVEAIRGVHSPGSATVSVQEPPAGPPDLDLPVADDWDGTGVVVRTSTAAQVPPTPLGPHVLSAVIESGGVELFPRLESAVHAVRAGDPLDRPSDADTGPVLVRGATVSGETRLALWFRRAAVSDPVRVTLRLADPLGRVTTRVIDVPAGPLGTAPSLDIVDAFEIRGRGVLLRLRSDAPVVDAGDGPHVMHIVATPVLRPIWPPWLRPRPLRFSVALPDIPTIERPRPFPPRDPIQVVRTGRETPSRYDALIRVGTPLRVTVAIVAPDGLRTERETRVGR
ncbi:MAG: hypothetical protein ACRDSE_12565 [Pseudonocardiaceae bacterium]